MKIITGKTGVPHVTGQDDAAFNAGVVGVGNYVLPNTTLTLTQTAALTFKLSKGEVLVHGVHGRIEGTETVRLDNGAQGMYRVDSVVARYELLSSGIEQMTIAVVKGTPSASDGAATELRPSLRDDDLYSGGTIAEMRLFDVKIFENNVEEIAPAFTVPGQLGDVSAVHPGESRYIVFYGAGYITDGAGKAYFSVPMPNRSKDVKGCTVTNAKAIIRQNGKYLVGSSSGAADASINWTSLNSAADNISINIPSGSGAANNEVCGVYFAATYVFN